MPSLAEALLPMHGGAWAPGSRAAQRKLTTLLLDPPSAQTATRIRNTIECALTRSDTSLHAALCCLHYREYHPAWIRQIWHQRERLRRLCTCISYREEALQPRQRGSVGHKLDIGYHQRGHQRGHQSAACRLCQRMSAAPRWLPSSRWVQVQQLLACGPSRNGQAVSAFQEILRLVRSVSVAADSRDAMQSGCFEGLLQIACSESGLDRRMGWDDFVGDCRVLEASVGRLVADPEEDVATPWERDVQDLDHCELFKEGDKAALTTFFMCATGSRRLVALQPAMMCGDDVAHETTMSRCFSATAQHHTAIQREACTPPSRHVGKPTTHRCYAGTTSRSSSTRCTHATRCRPTWLRASMQHVRS